MDELFENSEDPDQTPRSAASDLGPHCLPITLLGFSRLQWFKCHVTVVKCLPVLYHSAVVLLGISEPILVCWKKSNSTQACTRPYATLQTNDCHTKGFNEKKKLQQGTALGRPVENHWEVWDFQNWHCAKS